MATPNTEKLNGLFSRVTFNKMEENDTQDIVEYAKFVFGDGSSNPDPSKLHQFNELVVRQAEVVAKPMVTDMLSVFARKITANPNQVIQYKIPQKAKVKVRWTANGSGVDLVRVEGQDSIVASPRTFATGFYYEPFGIVQDAVEGTRNLVNAVAEAKVELYLKEINKLMEAAISSGDIPASNVLVGDNLTLKQYNKLASTLSRYGGRPVFAADPLLVDHFAMQQATGDFAPLLTDRIREELLTSLNPTIIGKTTAINLVNPFVDDANTKVALPVNEGYMFASAGSEKPFVVVEFGGMKQLTEQSMEDERVKMKLTQKADITLLFGQLIGKIKENTAVTL